MQDFLEYTKTTGRDKSYPLKDSDLWIDPRLASVIRFVGTPYPIEIFGGDNADSVLAHTFGAIGLVESLIPSNQNGISPFVIQQILSAHDYIEIYFGDQPVLNTTNEEEEAETDVLDKLEEYFDLVNQRDYFKQFELARRFIYGEIGNPPNVRVEAYLANLFDFIDGNTTFFELISSYVHNDGQLPNRKVSDETINGLLIKGNEYTEIVIQRFSMLIQRLPNDMKHRRLKTHIHHILNDHSEFVGHIVREIRMREPRLRELRRLTVLLIMMQAPADDPPPNWGFPRSRTLTGLRKKFIRMIQSGRIVTPCFTMFNNQIFKCLETIDENVVAETIKFGLLSAHRQLVSKPRTLLGLMNPEKRHSLAYELLNTRNTAAEALRVVRPYGL